MNELAIDFKDIVDEAQDIIIITKAFPLEKPGPEIVYVNKAFTRLTGYTPEEVIGNSPRILQSTETDKTATQKIREALDKKESVRVTLKNFSKVGDEYWLDLTIFPLKNKAGEVTHFAAIERDVTAQKHLEMQKDVLTERDPLTGLLNDRAFDTVMMHQFSLFTRKKNAYSILLIEIDNYQNLCDTHGHTSCDLILQHLTGTFELIFRSYDQIARTGTEEFCILLHHTSLEQALISALRFRKTVENTAFPVIDGTINISVSIGASEVISGDISFTDALERAENALYQAKNNGGNQVQIIKPRRRSDFADSNVDRRKSDFADPGEEQSPS